MVKDHSDSDSGNLLPPHGLLFLISSKGSFICTIQTVEHILWPSLHQLWSTGWNEKYLDGSTMKDRCNDPLHHERMPLPQSKSGSAICVNMLWDYRYSLQLMPLKNDLHIVYLAGIMLSCNIWNWKVQMAQLGFFFKNCALLCNAYIIVT